MQITFWRRRAPVFERAAAVVDRPMAERAATAEAIQLIDEHVEREARNRHVQTLPVRDLCPQQKEALVKDLARLLR